MATYLAGLHKEVSAIFDGVWIPEVDNNQQTLSVAAPAAAVYARPKLLAPDHWAFPQGVWPKKPKFAALTNLFKRRPRQTGPPRGRREDRRLSEISKHLLINQPKLSTPANRSS